MSEAEETSAALTAASAAVLEDLEQQYIAVCADRERLQKDLQSARSEISSFQEKLRDWETSQQTQQELQKQRDTANARIESLTEQQQNLQERLDRNLAEADVLRDEISRLTKTNAEQSQKLAELQIQSSLSESSAIPLLHEKHRLETTLDSLQAHVSFLEDCLKTKNTDYIRLQQDSRDQLVRLEFQLDQSVSEKQAVSAKLASATKLEATLTEQVSQLSKDLWNVKTELADSEEARKAERHEAERLHNLQKSHIANLEHRLSDVTRELEIMQNTARQAVSENEREKTELQESLEKKYQQLLHEQAQKYEDEKKKHRNAAAIVPASRLIAAANDAMEQKDREKEDDQPILGMTDLYQQLEETKARLREETAERKKWQLSFTRIRQDVMNKAPLLQRQREEYDIAIAQLTEYSERLENIIAERDDALADVAETRKDMAQLEMKLKDRIEENKELAKQLQQLLFERAKGVDKDFIAEMQNQNQRLLSDRMRLLQTIKDLEKRLESPDSYKKKLDETTQLMEKMKNERKQQEMHVAQIVQQRDLYRALLAKHDNKIIMGSDGDVNDDETSTALEVAKQQSQRAKQLEQRNVELEGDLKAIRSELNAISRENENLSERCSRLQIVHEDLTAKINSLERELLTSRSETARQNSDAQYHREKCVRLEETLERLRNETVPALNARADELSRINVDLQKSLSAANAACASSDSEHRQAEIKLKLAETQLQTARASEARQIADNEALRAEIARQSALIDSIRRIENNLTAKSENENDLLRNQLEKATTKLEAMENKQASQAESQLTRIQELEARIADLSSSHEKSQSDALKAKQELLDCKAEIQKLQSDCTKLESQLRSARRKLGEQGIEDDDSEALLKSQVDQLEVDLASARAEVVALQEQAETYQKLAKTHEEALSELKDATERLEAEHANEVELLSKQLENSKKDNASRQEIIQELTDDLAGQRSAREQREKELEGQIMALKTEIQNDEKDVQSARASLVELKQELEVLRNDVKAAQNNYERELRMHAETCSALRAARESMEEKERRCKIAQDNADSLKLEFDHQQEAWKQEKASLQETCRLLEKSVEDAREQNRILHSQLDTLSGMVEKSKASRLAVVAGDTSVADDTDIEETRKLVDELREVVKLLRSENELIQAELETAKRVSERERASANVARRSLEEARSELKTLQSQRSSDASIESTAYQEMTNKLRARDEQLDLLKDSNTLLREEVGKLKASMSASQNELNSVKISAQPVEELQRDLNSKIASLEAEKDSLSRELESWKERVKSLVSKFNQIDPEEHKLLAKKVEEMGKEKESFDAWKKATEDENSRIRQIAKTINLKLKEHQKTIESQKECIAKLTAEKEALLNTSKETSAASKEISDLKQKLEKMEKDAESVKTELLGANSRNDRLREKLREFQTIIRELRAKEKVLTEQLAVNTRAAPAASTAPTEEVRKESTTTDKIEPPTRAEPEASVKEVVPIKKQLATTIVVPDIPREGFKFGPSVSKHLEAPSSKEEANTVELPASTEQTTKESSQTSASALRASATPFVPGEAADLNRRSTSLARKTGEETKTQLATPHSLSPSSEAKTARRLSGETKEMSLKDKLLEKKRILEAARKAAEEKKRKLEAKKEVSSKEEKSADDQNEQAKKKSRTENNKDTTTSSQSSSGEEKSSTEPKVEILEKSESKQEQEEEGKLDAIPNSSIVSGIADVEPEKSDLDTKPEPLADTDGHEQEASALDISENIVEESGGAMEEDGEVMEEEAVISDEIDKKSETIPAIDINPSADPFAPAVGQNTAFMPAAIASPPAPFVNTGLPASSGGAFLDIKPPGTTDTPPIFTFGASSSIVLPTPTIQPPALSPFGAFGSGTSSHFGSVFGAVHSRPLFGAPSEPVIEEKGEKMEDEDDEAHMDAND